MTRLFAAALAALTLAASAQASTLSVFSADTAGLTFERQRDRAAGPGTFGVEFNEDWFKIGTATHATNRFSDANADWTGSASFFRFIYYDGLSEIALSRNEDFTNATTASFEGLFFKDSNALIFEANGRPDLTLTRFDGQAIDIDIGAVGGETWSDWEKVVFVSEGIADGFILDGRINMAKGGPTTINFDLGRATKYDAGDAVHSVAPIPVPAALPLLLAGLGGLLLLRRRRRR